MPKGRKIEVKSTKCTVLHLNAGHDRNGNPVRAYLVMHCSRGPIACVDEGYNGFSALNRKFGESSENMTVSLELETTKSQVKELLRAYPSDESCPYVIV
jgi:hypothetical protein